jgi:hypothetical protein
VTTGITPPPLPPSPPVGRLAAPFGRAELFDAELFDAEPRLAELFDADLRLAELFDAEPELAELFCPAPVLRERPLLDGLVRLRVVACRPLLLREERERLLLLFVPELVVAISPPG